MSIEAILPKVAAYIEEQTGLKPEGVGVHTWQRALRTRMAVNETTDPAAYLSRLLRSRFECQELVELLVVSETWFFRDRAAFDLLVKTIQERDSKGRKKPWRILSLACSTGEEPYSVAMALADANILHSRFLIEGVDISRRALEKAEKAVYTTNSFRGKNLFYRMSHFQETANGFSLDPQICTRVTFRYGNIIDPNFNLAGAKYDFIFCRNLLIYFSGKAQKEALDVCRHMLLPDGILFLGVTEGEIARSHGYSHIAPSPACAYMLKSGNLMEKPHKSLSLRSPIAAVSITHSESEKTKKQLLIHAKELSDQGKNDPAIALCMRYISQHNGDADVYVLLGNLHQAARRDDQAAHFLQKAVYLQPSRYEAWVNLALISERAGHKDQAELYWKRARQIQSAATGFKG